MKAIYFLKQIEVPCSQCPGDSVMLKVRIMIKAPRCAFCSPSPVYSVVEWKAISLQWAILLLWYVSNIHVRGSKPLYGLLRIQSITTAQSHMRFDTVFIVSSSSSFSCHYESIIINPLLPNNHPRHLIVMKAFSSFFSLFSKLNIIISIMSAWKHPPNDHHPHTIIIIIIFIISVINIIIIRKASSTFSLF